MRTHKIQKDGDMNTTSGQLRRAKLGMLILAAFASQAALAGDLNPGGPWAIRWDNTVKYSAAQRVEGSLPSLLTPNTDDGDRSLQKGLVSNRVDLLSEFDIQKDGFGLRVSGAAWYDAIYNRSNDHDSPATANKATVAYNEFTPGTRTTAGRKAEILDLFVFGQNDIFGKTLSYRIGQHSLIWGTSLFFGMNGIAKGMSPIDVYKLSIPGAQAKETTIPVPRVSGTLQLTDDTSIEAYVQTKYRETRLHPAGSYLSGTDMLGDGAERFFIGDPTLNGRQCGSTAVAPAQRFANCYLNNLGIGDAPNTKDVGFALNTRSELLNADLGLYALHYRDSSQYIETNTAGGTYRLMVPKKLVTSLGASISRLVGETNVGLEVSVRDKQPLVAKEGVVSSADNSYVTGRTAHMNLSMTSLMGPAAFWSGSSLVGELAANHVMSIDDVLTTVAGRVPVGTAKVNLDRNKTSYGMRVIWTPTFYQVAPGLDLSVPLNAGGWSFKGKSMIDNAFPFSGSPDRGGELIVGLAGVYLSKWSGSLSAIHYVGKADTQSVLDRDYLRFSLQTSF
jgi:hypothetical protein